MVNGALKNWSKEKRIRDAFGEDDKLDSVHIKA
jgi:hypothetical protein